MKIILRICIFIVLLAVGFAIGYPLGQHEGFSIGSEWALMQADLMARESGLFMPILYDGEQFRVVMRQPPHLYRRAWKLADMHQVDGTDMLEDDGTAPEHIQLAGNTAPTP
jgi:hypothetical protein